MLLRCNNIDIARTKHSFDSHLTYLHNFSVVILKKIIYTKEVPPFHPRSAIWLISSKLGMVELLVEFGWNFMKFHPNSTHNSTTRNSLIIKMITERRWKGGIINDKIYFSEKWVGNVLTTVK